MACNCGRPAPATAIIPPKLNKLGTCTLCIYGTLTFSTGGWIGYLGVAHDQTYRAVGYGFLALAVPSTVLFVAHMAAILIRKAEAGGSSPAIGDLR